MKTYPVYKKSGVKWLGDLPEHWALTKVGRSMYLGRGRVISNIEIGDNPGEYPVYSSQTSDNGVMGYIATYDFEGNYATWTTDGANAGRVFYRTGKFNCTNVCGTMKPKNDKVYLPYIPYLLNLGTRYYVRYDINPKLMNGEMAQIEICLPPLPEQQTITDFLDHKTAQIDTLIEKKRQQIDLLQEQRIAFINRAVTKGLNLNVALKDSGLEWLGEIPRHWGVKQLRHIIKKGTSITYGIVQAGPDYEGGIPYIRTQDMSGTELPREGYLKTSPEIDKSYERSKVNTGDIVIAIRATVGKALIVPEYLEGANLTQGTAKISPSESVHQKFLYWAINSENCQNQIESISKGATFKEITLYMLRRVGIPFPPLEEQEEISRFLDQKTYDTDLAIERIRKQIDLLIEYRTALISEAVTGKIDVRADV